MLRLLLLWLPGLCLSGVALLLLAAGIGQIMPEYTLAFVSYQRPINSLDLYLLAIPYRLLFPLNVVDFDGLNSLAWSPDGQNLAYSALNIESYDIFKLNIITRERTILIEHPASDSGVTWSPDGKFLGFTSNRGNSADLYTLEMATGAITQLDNHPGIAMLLQWSPDGSQIAYTSNQDRGSDLSDISIQILDLATHAIKSLPSLFVSNVPVWSPDGRWLAFSSTWTIGRNVDIFRLDMTTQFTINLTQHPANDSYPSLSIDGHWMAFISDRNGNSEVYLMELLSDGQPGEVHRLDFNRPSDNYLPVWRP